MRYKQLVERADDIIYGTDKLGYFTLVSPAFLKILKYSEQEALSMRYLEVIQEDYRRPAGRFYKRQLVKKIPNTYYELLAVAKDGVEVWLGQNVRLNVEGGGGFQTVARDVTERKRAEVRLHLLARAVESTSELISITDLEDRFTFVNKAFLDAYGYETHEVVGKSPAELFDSANNPAALRGEIRLRTRQGSWKGEILNRRKDGSEFPIFLSTSQIKDGDGRIIGLLGVARDVTERRRAEKQLLESERRFRQLAETICDAFWVLDPQDDRLLYVSPAYEQIWGRTCASLYEDSKSFLKALHHDDREYAAEEFSKHRRGENSSVEYRVVRPDGEIRWVWDRGFPIKDEYGDVYRVVGIAEDVTGRKQSEEFLRQSEARNSAMLNAIPDLMFRFRGDGEILDFSAPSPEGLLAPPGDLIGKNLRDVVMPPVAQQALQHINSAIETRAMEISEYELETEGVRG